MSIPSRIPESSYLNQIQHAVERVDKPEDPGIYFRLDGEFLTAVVEKPKDPNQYYAEMHNYIQKIRNIPHTSKIHATLDRMERLIAAHRQALTTPDRSSIFMFFRPSIDQMDNTGWVLPFISKLRTKDPKEALYLKLDADGNITTGKGQTNETQINNVVDFVRKFSENFKGDLSIDELESLVFILNYLKKEKLPVKIPDADLAKINLLIHELHSAIENLEQISGSLHAAVPIDFSERSPIIKLPSQEELDNNFTKITFSKPKNKTDVNEEMKQLANQRFSSFVPLDDLKNQPRPSGNSPEEKAKANIWDWNQANPGIPFPTLAAYAKLPDGTLKPISETEKFYVNLYHETGTGNITDEQKVNALSYQDIYALHLLKLVYSQKPTIQGVPLLQEMANANDNLKKEATSLAYSDRSLVNFYVKKKYFDKHEKASTTTDNLKKQTKEINDLKAFLANVKGCTPTAQEKTDYDQLVQKLETKIKELDVQNNNPQSQLQIEKSALLEKAFTSAVDEILPLIIDAGFYVPKNFGGDILDLFEPGKQHSAQYPLLLEADEKMAIEDKKDIPVVIDIMLSDYIAEGKLEYHHKEAIMHQVADIIDNYQRIFPNKSTQDMFYLSMVVARTMAYQEYYDKAAFPGSDHGTKHIHHNIQMALQFIKGIDPNDITAKDKFMIEMVHIFHDFGYASGIAGINFDASKDHPIISGAFLNANLPFFEAIFDKPSVNAMVRSVQNHAIIRPDFSPDKVKTEGCSSDLMRTISSTSDSCALTSDRKTQEFWDDIRALKIVARLKIFVTNHPEYLSKFKSPTFDPDDLKNSQVVMDKIAYGVYKGIKDDLHKLVDTQTTNPDLKARYHNAIDKQFGFMTAHMAIGQFGAVLEGVDLKKNEDDQHMALPGPKYLPLFDICPSPLFNVLGVGFSDDDAFNAFQKLLEEFSANPQRIEKVVKLAAEQLEVINSIKTGFEKKYDAIKNQWPTFTFDDAKSVQYETFARNMFPFRELNDQRTKIAFGAFRGDYAQSQGKIDAAKNKVRDPILEANAIFQVRAPEKVEKPTYVFGSVPGKQMEKSRKTQVEQSQKQPSTGSEKTLAQLLSDISYGKSRKMATLANLRENHIELPQIGEIAFSEEVLNKTKDLEASPELKEAGIRINQISKKWEAQLQPVRTMFSALPSYVSTPATEQILMRYIQSLEALRKDQSKFTEAEINSLNKKFSTEFEKLDTTFQGYGVQSDLKSKFDNSTQTIAKDLSANAKEWQYCEELLESSYNYMLTLAMTDAEFKDLLVNVPQTEQAAYKQELERNALTVIKSKLT